MSRKKEDRKGTEKPCFQLGHTKCILIEIRVHNVSDAKEDDYNMP